jgi:hypothetical protein
MIDKDMNRIIQLKGTSNHYIKVNDFYMVYKSPYCLVDANNWYSEELIGNVRDTFSGKDLKSKERNLIIILDRMDSNSRVLGNHQKIKILLTKNYPNERFVFWNKGRDQKSIEETIALFKRAKIIISTHGAQLFNMLWAAKGTKILEIGFMDKEYPFPSTYYSLSQSLGHKYFLMIGKGGLFTECIQPNINLFMKYMNKLIYA